MNPQKSLWNFSRMKTFGTFAYKTTKKYVAMETTQRLSRHVISILRVRAKIYHRKVTHFFAPNLSLKLITYSPIGRLLDSILQNKVPFLYQFIK